MALNLKTIVACALALLAVPSASMAIPEELQDIIDKDTDYSYASDKEIVETTLDSLYSIGNSTTLNKCQQCISRLALGKSLALTKPSLVPEIWTKWCVGSNTASSSSCKLTYGRNTVESSTTGSNFVNMLGLMDPASLDGEYYCYFKENAKCPLPKTPEVDISYMWPEKPEKALVAPTPGDELVNVLHVSDFHIELDYTIGGEANCTNSMCCTPQSKNALKVPSGYNYASDLTDDEKSGINFYNSSYVEGIFTKGNQLSANETSWLPAFGYGFYECDAPEILINSSLDSISQYQQEKNISFDFAIFTGDLVDHDETRLTSYEVTVESEEIIFRDVKYKLKDIPLFSVLGNHDTFPYGELAQEKSGFANMFDWNAELMAEMWLDYSWIDLDTARNVKSHYTGFSVETKDGLKVIALNANCWYYKNNYAYWNMTSDPDSFGQFQFLVDELVESEAKDQRVWIINHIPASADILPIQSKLFADVIERFSPYTIAHVFNGHTHRDEFQVLYKGNGTDDDAKTIDNVIANTWIAQAVTPWVENNPAWRYYEVDKKTFSIMNSYNFYTRLNETFYANGDEPVWEFEYSARDAYGVEWPENAPLNATYWHLVGESIHSDVSVLQDYENYAKRFSPYTGDCTDGDCDLDWCYVTSFTYDQYQNCIAVHDLKLPTY
ncbi:hypothetical protein BVG19_g624 [[Candida] boidinii]|nr:hypothetical protein BVG19_g624 [[Candida] boidinii]OWB51533.1 hypothetical protein B5S27_g3096 [[Candida] boidinii]